jgi:hypothetical protein
MVVNMIYREFPSADLDRWLTTDPREYEEEEYDPEDDFDAGW